MKNLKIIQIISKIAKIISKIVFVCSIIGAVGSLIGIVTMFIIKGNADVQKYVTDELHTNIASLIATMFVSMALSVSQIYVAYKSEKYFAHELEIGNPFTHELTKELRKLALISIIVNFGVTIICAIGVGIANAINSDIVVSDDIAVSIDYGITLLIISLFCGYGADIKDNSDTQIQQNN